MKIQLINSPQLTRRSGGGIASVYPPLGILYLASYVRQFHQDIIWKISDGALDGHQKIIGDIDNFQPDILGISFTTPYATGAFKVANLVKERQPKTFVVCGGPHPSAMPEETLRRSKADIVVSGEGEQSMLDIVNKYTQGKINDMRGKIVASDTPITDLDTIPFPARDLIDLKRYTGYHLREKSPETSLLSSRGCVYNCWHCSNPVWRTGQFSIRTPRCRMRSPKNIVDEIQFLYEKCGMREFFDECDEFNINLKWSSQVCDELLKRKIDIKWKVQLRAGHITEELVAQMAKSGCWLAFVGIESGNQETLDGINKKVTLPEIEKTCLLLKKHGIKVFGLFMTFNVWEKNGQLRYENVDDSLNTLRYAKMMTKRKLLDHLSWTITTPFPASPLWNTCMKFDLIPEEKMGKWELWDTNWNLVMDLPGVSEKDWIKIRYEGLRLQASAGFHNVRELNAKTFKLFVERGLKMAELWWESH